MITRTVRLKNLAFLVIAVLVLGFVGVRYADLGRYAGVADHYTVRVHLARTGGLFTHSDVTYRGVSVGRVGAIDLTAEGVVAELRIKNSAPGSPPTPAPSSPDSPPSASSTSTCARRATAAPSSPTAPASNSPTHRYRRPSPTCSRA